MKETNTYKDLSVWEFSEFCAEQKPQCFIYASENQPDYPHDALLINARFQRVVIVAGLCPNRICFISDTAQISVERVKFVRVYDEKPCVGTVLKIFSKSTEHKSPSVWLMDK